MNKVPHVRDCIQPDLFETNPRHPQWWTLPTEVQERLRQLLRQLLHEHVAGQPRVQLETERCHER
jgi:hypothetical protein